LTRRDDHRIVSSIVAAIALNLDRQAEQLPMVLLEPFEVRLDRDRDVLGIFYCLKMIHELAVMFGLAWKAERGILFVLDFCIGHNLNFLGWRWRLRPARRLLGAFPFMSADRGWNL
jgi:hypothetical protein